MGSPRIALWLGAVICGALICTPAEAGGIFKWFSHRSQAECESCQGEAPACQQPCQCQCKECPPKKKHVCCFCPPEPPRAPIGISIGAIINDVLTDVAAPHGGGEVPPTPPKEDKQAERFDKLEKDVTRLTVIVEKLVEIQTATPPEEKKAEVDPVPPGPIPAAARTPATQRIRSVQQTAAPTSRIATGR